MPRAVPAGLQPRRGAVGDLPGPAIDTAAAKPRTFRDFMEAALYGEGGYYQHRTPGEDFYTAPELHPAFGAVLADELARRLAGAGPKPVLVEQGCGDGTLFAGVHRRLRERHPRLEARLGFVLVERSNKALAAARVACPELGRRLRAAASLDELDPFEGVLYSNELLDALPFHLIEQTPEGMREVMEPGCDSAPIAAGPLRDAAERIAPDLAPGERHAVCLERARWLEAVSGKLRRGFVVSVDYGRRYPPDAPVAVKTFEKHRLGGDPEVRPGRRDITAPVDFEGLIRDGCRFGFREEEYVPLGRFLLDRGLMDFIAPAPAGAAGYAERNRLKTLIHPDGMGEIFKVLIQSKGLPRSVHRTEKGRFEPVPDGAEPN